MPKNSEIQPPLPSDRRKPRQLSIENYKTWPAHRPLVERFHRQAPVRTGVPVFRPEHFNSFSFWQRLMGLNGRGPRRWLEWLGGLSGLSGFTKFRVVGQQRADGDRPGGLGLNAPGEVPNALEELALTVQGYSPQLLAYTSLVPWVTRLAIMSSGPLCEKPDGEMSALIGYFQNRDAGCRYGFGLAVAALRAGGWNTIKLSQLTKAQSKVMTPLQHTVVHYAVKIERGLPVKPSTKQFTRKGASEDLAEGILSEPFFQVMRIRLAMALGLPPELEIEEAAEEGRLFKRGLFSRSKATGQANTRQMRRTIAGYETAPGAFAGLVDTDFPGKAGRRMHTMLCEAFASPVFETRTKALMLCAAGRELECSYLESVGREMIEPEDLPAGLIDELLAGRFTERLGEIENALCEFMRLSIRPKAEVFYKKAETLRGVLTEREIIELAGFSALVNGVGRMLKYSRGSE